MNKHVKSLVMAVFLLMTSFIASAIVNPPTNIYGWVAPPSNATDINLQNYYVSVHNGTNKYLDIWFYNSTEHLGFVRKMFVLGDPKYGQQFWYMYSNKTQIGSSYYMPDGQIGNKFMCPDGHSATVKRHIDIMTKTFPRWKYNTSDVYPGQPCGYVPQPTNKTDISTIQWMYGPNYTVIRMFPNRDIFSVRCLVIPACEVYDGITTRLTAGVTYLSNTQRIAYRWSNFDRDFQFVAVRTKDTVTDQIAKDDIDILVGAGVEGQPWSWVDYWWDPKFTSWMN